MTLKRNITAFSHNGEYLAYSSPDGCLKIWETSTGILKQEYTPSSHLSTTCSSLAWGPHKHNSHLPKSPKKLKTYNASTFGNLQLIAMGTLTGDILLYSYANAELHSFLTNGHTGAVNDLCWSASSNTLFSCSNDQYIIHWDVCSGKIKAKWKADKVAIQSICVIDDNSLLSASTSIVWWNIEKKSVVKSFNGHATEVFCMIPLNIVGESTNQYILSAAVGDRVINVWQLNENSYKSAVSSFVLTGEPVNINVLLKKNEPFRMSTVTKEGSFHFFEHTLNGKTKKPLLPKFTIQIASKSNTTCKPYPVPILAANISEGLDSCVLTYGNYMKPQFENINISEFDTDLFLIRDLSSSVVSIEDAVTKVKHTEKASNVKTLAPGHMTEIALLDSTSKKRKQKEVDIKELPMEMRLKALDLSKIPKNLPEQEPTIKSDSMVHLLLQGLQSKDNNMLNTVMQCGDETIIYNTLERLPLNSIPLVLKELYRRLNKKEPSTHPCLRWLSGLLDIHRSYLMSGEDIDKYFEPFSQLFEARAAENFAMMSRLRGCFKLAISKANTNYVTYTDPSSIPLVEYESGSSDESEDGEVDMSGNSSDNEIDHESKDEDSELSDSESDMED